MAPASADDLIAQWLQQDEVSGQTEEVRPDLNAITDEQWREMFAIGRARPDAFAQSQTNTFLVWLEIFAIGREQPDAFAHLLVKHGSKSQTDIFLVWLAILTAALALLVGGIQGSAGIRRQLRTLTAPVHMNDPSQGLIATAK